MEGKLKRINHLEKIRKLRIAADEGDGKAMSILGCSYARGELGLTQDFKLARSWYEAAAAKNNPSGLGNYGLCLLTGQGGPKNKVMGVYYTMLGAEMGSACSLVTLGKGFQFASFGFPKNHNEARYWYQKVINHPDCASVRKRRVTEYLAMLAGEDGSEAATSEAASSRASSSRASSLS